MNELSRCNYEAILGLKPETEAYRTWTVKPPLRSEFRHVTGSMECPYGKIEIEYQKVENDGSEQITMNVTVPTSTTGILVLPRDDSAVIVARLPEQNKRAVTKTGKRVFLTPGVYHLTLSP